MYNRSTYQGVFLQRSSFCEQLCSTDQFFNFETNISNNYYYYVGIKVSVSHSLYWAAISLFDNHVHFENDRVLGLVALFTSFSVIAISIPLSLVEAIARLTIGALILPAFTLEEDQKFNDCIKGMSFGGTYFSLRTIYEILTLSR